MSIWIPVSNNVTPWQVQRHLEQLEASFQGEAGAAAVGVLDAGGFFTGTTVEEVLQELAGGVPAADLETAPATAKTIAAGVVAATQSYHSIETEAAAASDDLDTVSGLNEGQFFIFKLATVAHNVVIKHGTGNIICPNAMDITLDVANDKVFGFYDGSKLIVLDMNLATASAGGFQAALASVAASKGASLVGIQDAGALIAAATVEGALAEIATSVATKTTAATLALTTAGNGASLVGVQDAGALYAATTVEAALAEARTSMLSKPATELTIAGGIIALTQSYHTIDTEADAASDDLNTLTGIVDGQVYFFRNASVGRAVVFKSGVDSIIAPGGFDVTMTAAGDTVMGFGYGGFLVILPFTLSSMQGGGLGEQLFSSAGGQGASKVGIADAGGFFAGSNVEAALGEVGPTLPTFQLVDPGNAGAIPVITSGAVALVSLAAETRTLAIPTFIGQELSIFFQTDGGDIVITAASAINVAGNTTITLGTANSSVVLKSVWTGAARAWRVVVNDGTVLG